MNLIIKFLLISALLLISSNRSIETIDNQSKKDKKPNIIFILTDDHTTNAISAYGSIYKDIAPTPNIDRIAKEGAIEELRFISDNDFGGLESNKGKKWKF